MVMRHHEELRQKEEKAKRDEHAKIRRVASSIAKEVRAFWSSVEKVQMNFGEGGPGSVLGRGTWTDHGL